MNRETAARQEIPAGPSSQPLLSVENLTAGFATEEGRFKVLEGVSCRVDAGRTVGLVGESGCGKSTLGRTAIRLHEPTAGRITFQGHDLLKPSQRELRRKRKEMQLIFQDPYASLDTRQRVGNIIAEPLRIHRVGDRRFQRDKVLELLRTVGLPEDGATRFPHEFSGGQRQRIGIARAVALQPKLIVADEPVSALDVSIQSQILNLLVELREKLGLAYIFISHDLAVVKHISERIAVMYLGLFVEEASAERLFSRPLHPYTEALVSAIPRLDPRKRRRRVIVKGDIPDPSRPPSGCRFHPRCHKALDVCSRSQPPAIEMGDARHPHRVWCHVYA